MFCALASTCIVLRNVAKVWTEREALFLVWTNYRNGFGQVDMWEKQTNIYLETFLLFIQSVCFLKPNLDPVTIIQNFRNSQRLTNLDIIKRNRAGATCLQNSCSYFFNLQRRISRALASTCIVLRNGAKVCQVGECQEDGVKQTLWEDMWKKTNKHRPGNVAAEKVAAPVRFSSSVFSET